MSDLLREALAAVSPIRGDDPEGAAHLETVLEAARAYAELLENGNMTAALRLADELGVMENGHNLNGPTFRRLVFEAARKETTK